MKTRQTIPAYQRIKSVLRAEILDGKQETLSESRIIRRFDVSSATARRVLNELEDEALLVRKVGKGSVVQRPSDKTIKELGAVFFDIFSVQDMFVGDIIRAIEEKAKAVHFHLHLYTTRARGIANSPDLSLHHLIVQRRIDGLFLLSPLPVEDVRFLLDTRIPCVALANRYPDLPIPSVTSDFTPAVLNAGRRLLAMGHRRIGLVSGPAQPSNIESGRNFMMTAYQSLLEHLHLPDNSELLQKTDLSESGGHQAMTAWYQLPADQRPQAMLVTSVKQSLGVHAFLNEHPDWRPFAIYMAEQHDDFAVYLFSSSDALGRAAYDLIQAYIQSLSVPPPSIQVPVELHWP